MKRPAKPLETVARSPAMRRVVDLAGRVAQVDSTVLVTGERGAGKKRIARLVHDESARAAGPFVEVDCAAVPEALLERELFGHARGAYAGATRDRAGLFEAADHGTLLLSQIGMVPPHAQVKVLRAVQERAIRRAGETVARLVDVRVIVAADRDHTNGIAGAAFHGLLDVVEIHVPPLRERGYDLLPLAQVLLVAAARRTKRKVIGLAPGAADQLLRYEWPGNVSELRDAMEHAVASADGNRVELADLPKAVRRAVPRAVPSGEVVRPLDEMGREYILAALALNSGDRAHTAEQLHIATSTLHRKLGDKDPK